MRRRTYLAVVGATFAAGCVGGPGTGEPTDPGTTTGDPADDETPTGTPTGGQPPTDSPVTDGGGSRFSGEPCPSFTTNADRTVCWHAVDPGQATYYLEPSSELFEPTTAEDEVETMEFVFHNEGDGGFGLNPHAWSIHRRTDGGWERVAPDAYPEPWTVVQPGGTYTWQFSVVEHSAPMSEDSMAVVEDLDSGVYAFAVDGAPEDSGETRVGCLALFEVRRG